MPTEIESPMWAMARHDVCGAAGTGAAGPSRPRGRRGQRRAGQGSRHGRVTARTGRAAISNARSLGRASASGETAAMGTTTASTRTRSWWGWGYEDQAVGRDEMLATAGRLAERFGRDVETIDPPARRRPRPARAARGRRRRAFAEWCSTAPTDRAGHTYGKSYRDIVRAVHGDLPDPPDVVAFPPTEADVVALLDWCSSEAVAAIPYGGGSSVVGGVECAVGDGFAGVVSIDLGRLDRVLEVDPVSRAARIQAGALGPVLEEQLRPHGYTLRHFPQSFELSTLGGWLATRSGGHYASVYTHIDDLVESMRVVTPTGISESRRLPGSGAGPSPDRLFLGSEGSLGIITEAWMRVQDRPRWRASAGVVFGGYADGVAATRAVAQSGLFPTNCRLLDGLEAATAAGTSGVGGAARARLRVGRPPRRRVDRPGRRAVPRPRRRGPGRRPHVRQRRQRRRRGARRRRRVVAFVVPPGAVPAQRPRLLRDAAGDVRDGLHVGRLRRAPRQRDRRRSTDALQRICGGGWVTCRFTHVYPDGPAPYFSITAPGRIGSELAMWDEIKAAASEALLAAGGTITHHHAVGRDHDPWYRRQRPDAVRPGADGGQGASSTRPASSIPGVIV